MGVLMRLNNLGLVAAVVVAAGIWSSPSGGVAQTETINFDEFPSPPVTGSIPDGVPGPLTYPYVVVSAGGDGGWVLNGSGWNNLQTSGYNLFGTRLGPIDLTFSTAVSDLSFDGINGNETNVTYSASVFGKSGNLLQTENLSLGAWPNSSAVGNFDFSINNIWSASMTITPLNPFQAFAIDTVSFNVSSMVGSNPGDPVLPYPGPPVQGCKLLTLICFFSPSPDSWFDPTPAKGFVYRLQGGGDFTEVGAPPSTFGFGSVDVVIGGRTIDVLQPGGTFDFGPGVSTFSLKGINPTVDASNP